MARLVLLLAVAVLVGCVSTDSETVHGTLVAVARSGTSCTIKIAPVNGDNPEMWSHWGTNETICRTAEDLLGRMVLLHTIHRPEKGAFVDSIMEAPR
jgi:hypothetical protein